MKPQLEESYRSLTPQELTFMWQKHSKTAGRSPNVVEYQDVINARDIDDVFKGQDAVILFYPNFQSGGSVAGHYVSLLRHPESHTILFYDPYGLKPDTQKRFAGKQKDELYDERENTLIRHLLNSGWNVDYNEHVHQSKAQGVATCGRHSLNRILYKDLTNDQYNQLIRHATKKYGLGNIDDTVSTMWL